MFDFNFRSPDKARASFETFQKYSNNISEILESNLNDSRYNNLILIEKILEEYDCDMKR